MTQRSSVFKNAMLMHGDDKEHPFVAAAKQQWDEAKAARDILRTPGAQFQACKRAVDQAVKKLEGLDKDIKSKLEIINKAQEEKTELDGKRAAVAAEAVEARRKLAEVSASYAASQEADSHKEQPVQRVYSMLDDLTKALASTQGFGDAGAKLGAILEAFVREAPPPPAAPAPAAGEGDTDMGQGSGSTGSGSGSAGAPAGGEKRTMDEEATRKMAEAMASAVDGVLAPGDLDALLRGARESLAKRAKCG